MENANTGKIIRYSFLIAVALMFVFSATAEETVLFYGGNSDSSQTGGLGEKEYTANNKLSNLSESLESNDFTVNRVTSYIGPDILDRYEPNVIVLPNPKGTTPKQIGELLRWTARDGGNLWVCAEPQSSVSSTGPSSVSRVNMVSKALGMTVSGSLLEDRQNNIVENITEEEQRTYTQDSTLSTSQKFKVYRSKDGINSNSYVNGITMGVDEVGFFGASGIIIQDNANKVWTAVSGEETTYTPNAPVFLKGSYPSLVAATKFGNGRAVMTSDCDAYANENINKFDNHKLAMNSFEWLTPNETIQSMNYTEAILKSESLNREKIKLQSEVEDLESEVSQLESTNSELRAEASSQETEESGGISMALISAVVFFLTLVVLVVALREELKNKFVKGEVSDTVNSFKNQVENEDSESGSEDLGSKADELGEDLDVN